MKKRDRIFPPTIFYGGHDHSAPLCWRHTIAFLFQLNPKAAVNMCYHIELVLLWTCPPSLLAWQPPQKHQRILYNIIQILYTDYSQNVCTFFIFCPAISLCIGIYTYITVGSIPGPKRLYGGYRLKTYSARLEQITSER